MKRKVNKIMAYQNKDAISNQVILCKNDSKYHYFIYEKIYISEVSDYKYLFTTYLDYHHNHNFIRYQYLEDKINQEILDALLILLESDGNLKLSLDIIEKNLPEDTIDYLRERPLFRGIKL